MADYHLFNTAGRPLSRFSRCSGGLANAVYTDSGTRTILKIYEQERFYRAERLVSASGFARMPKHLEFGEHKGKHYILMDFVGESVSSFSAADVPALASAIAELHRIQAPAGMTFDAERFVWLLEYEVQIHKALGVSIRALIENLRTRNSGDPLCLTHGDLDTSNIRKTDDGFYLIDFDEADYSLPYLDIAKLYWSGTVLMDPVLLEEIAASYSVQSGRTLERDVLVQWILVAGIDFWCWRMVNATPALAEDALEVVKLYCKAYAQT